MKASINNIKFQKSSDTGIVRWKKIKISLFKMLQKVKKHKITRSKYMCKKPNASRNNNNKITEI